MSYDFDTLIDRFPTESAKWHVFEPDVLPMWVADMDFRSPEPVIQALHQRVEHGIFGYPKESPELRQVIIERLARLYGWKVNPEEILFLPGVIGSFNLACYTFANPGESVLIQPPVYPPFFSAAKYAQLTLQENPLVQLADGSYSIDFDAFERAITPSTRVFILCNPHNPVGRVFRREELEKMAEICLRHNVLICSDEIHCDLVYTGHPHLPVASLHPEIASQTITLMAPSKTFNIAGLDCSFAIIPNEELRKRYEAARQGRIGGVNLFGYQAALSAYQYGQPWLDELLVYLEANRDWLYDFVKQNLPGIRMAKPEGTYLAWMDCREAGIPGAACEYLIKQARVALNDGCTFGPGGDGFVRLNFASPRAMLVEGMQRIQHALSKLG